MFKRGREVNNPLIVFFMLSLFSKMIIPYQICVCRQYQHFWHPILSDSWLPYGHSSHEHSMHCVKCLPWIFQAAGIHAYILYHNVCLVKAESIIAPFSYTNIPWAIFDQLHYKSPRKYWHLVKPFFFYWWQQFLTMHFCISNTLFELEIPSKSLDICYLVI